MRWLVILIVLSCLAGCGITSQQTYMPDGRAGYLVNCNFGSADCYRQAGELCGRAGYDVINKTDEHVVLGNSASPRHSLLISCRR